MSLRLLRWSLGELIHWHYLADGTMPSFTQVYKKYLAKVCEKDVTTIRDTIRYLPVAVTLDKSPNLRGCPAVTVMGTFYNSAL